MRVSTILAGVAASVATVQASPVETVESRSDLQPRIIMTNDWNCKSDNNPVIMLHGLLVSRNFDLNLFETWLRPHGYCTYGLTYGVLPQFPLNGGLKRVSESAQEIVDFINEVLQKTGAKKVDLVGHSEGGFQALYVAKVKKMSEKIDKIVAIAPPTHGSSYNSVVQLAELLNIRPQAEEILKAVGCPACTDVIAGGSAVKELTDGPIVQPGNKVTVIATKYDTVVTPAGKSSFINEPGVNNVLTQDVCWLDFAGHTNLAIDTNVFHIARNALRDTNGKWFLCNIFSGLPFKR
ncbi:hypothetical protein NLG97_g6399 [Lecanicillium saksenae]|uniref:Uncharacterized protein n=1 Tax=Lecanicillium saksenae TaxID=468837 RepID=A0ACC1QRD4_9HYPO|nr:hypothetical protein NLG97_g6399 [Lecanicillium saksenae]